MIAPVYARVGEPFTIEGYADDYGGQIDRIEFSLDGGLSWAAHDVSASDPGLSVHWTFTYTPTEPGTLSFAARAVAADGRRTPVAACADVHVS